MGLALAITTGCGGKSGSVSTPLPVHTPPSVQAITITGQPLSQTIPPGGTATFAVAATSAAPLSYQWSENGAEIAGATSATYTTPEIPLGAAVPSTIGSYVVTVSNSSTSIASDAATLTAGPRSPKAGDLRYLLFEQVDLPGLGKDGGLVSNIDCGGDCTSTWIGNTVGTPLGLGSSTVCSAPLPGYIPGNCAWRFDAESLPPPMTGLTMFYKAGYYGSFGSDMQSINAPNVVITSLDLEPAPSEAYAVSWVETEQAGGFDYKLEAVPPAQIQATAAQDGAESRVITAVSFDGSGNADLISYGWTGDATTVYETQTAVATPENIVSAATTLAGDGYFISAFGGNDTIGYMLIGTRVKGDSLPRPITVYTDAGGYVPATNPDSAYFTTVVYLLETTSGYTLLTEQ
ncbi:MAG: immunoglobulin domain-containing protein [Terracidiphilus sp.]|jgi:hypothetical protein